MPTRRLSTVKGGALTVAEGENVILRPAEEKTTDYTLDATHNQEFHELGGTIATVTLPTLSASFTETDDWFVDLKNTLATNITINRNSQTIDGAAANFTLEPGGHVRIRMNAAMGGFYTDRAALGAAGYILRSNGTVPEWSQPIVLATADSASGDTFVDFTGIPAWATQIIVNVAGLSTNGTAIPKIQLGDSGGVEPTGYAGSVVTLLSTGTTTDNLSAGFNLSVAWSAASVANGSYTFTLLQASTNTWVCEGGVGYSNTAAISNTRGYKNLSGTLDRVRVIMDGTDQFDGSTIINISYS